LAPSDVNQLPASHLNEITGPPKLEQNLNKFLNPKGYYVQYAPRLPRKLLTVRSGLGLYGRNNICYVKNMGSFLFLATYFTNISCVEDEWHEIGHMTSCRTCTACMRNCPTSAIMNNRFLIDNERCLTYLNEANSDQEFPQWLDTSSHHTIYGCLRCQEICPMNKDYLNKIIRPAEFTEEETKFLLKGKPFETFSQTLKQKIEFIDMKAYLGALPRNLKILFRSIGK
jgi:epoxyqueuosine reductase